MLWRGATFAIREWRRCWARHRRRTRQKDVYTPFTVPYDGNMESMTEALVLVPLQGLRELLELLSIAADRLPPTDPLTLAMRGAGAQLRSQAIPEPF